MVPSGGDSSSGAQAGKGQGQEIVLETVGAIDSIAIPRQVAGEGVSGAATRAAVLEARLKAEEKRGSVRISSGLPNVK